MIPARVLLLATTAALAATTAHARDMAKDKAAIEASLDKNYAHLDALYKDIHQHPELGMQETRTAAKLAAEMRTLGFEVTEHVGKTGIVAIFKNGRGPLVMIRTELDALPMKRRPGCPTPATWSPTITASRRRWTTVAATTSTWPHGSAPPSSWSP
jgi:metal-dependent amidase/aminoacylase/carboxypeptidase family protein